jgi:hypothetical protein
VSRWRRHNVTASSGGGAARATNLGWEDPILEKIRTGLISFRT